MKLAIVFVFCFVGLALAQNNKYDNIDLDKILKNDRVLTSYIKCLLEKGPCTPEGRDLRNQVPKVLETKCEKCTENQKTLIRKALTFVQQNKPKDYQQLLNKYDPDNTRRADLEKFLRGEL